MCRLCGNTSPVDLCSTDSCSFPYPASHSQSETRACTPKKINKDSVLFLQALASPVTWTYGVCEIQITLIKTGIHIAVVCIPLPTHTLPPHLRSVCAKPPLDHFHSNTPPPSTMSHDAGLTVYCAHSQACLKSFEEHAHTQAAL